MKKTLLFATMVAMFSAAAMAADGMPTLLFESTGMDRPKSSKSRGSANTANVSSATAVCEPAPEPPCPPPVDACGAPPTPVAVCEPAPPPACPPPVNACGVCVAPTAVAACSATPLCSAAISYKFKEVPMKMVVEEMKMVPTKRRVVEEEAYLVHEKRTGSYPEMRTRTAKRTIELPTTKMVSEAKILQVKPEYGTAIRLARGVNRKVVVTTRKEVQEYEENYMAQVKYNYTVPIAKTRKVAKTVEEFKAVPVRRTIAATEMRMVAR